MNHYTFTDSYAHKALHLLRNALTVHKFGATVEWKAT